MGRPNDKVGQSRFYSQVVSLTFPPIPLFRITLRRRACSQNTEQYSDDDEDDDKNCRLFLDAVVGRDVGRRFVSREWAQTIHFENENITR